MQLRSIPKTKIDLIKNDIINSCDYCSKYNRITCNKCSLKATLLDRYVDANIPIDFINRSIKDFVGDKKIKTLYEDIINDIPKAYKVGRSFCFRGNHGTGKTFISCLVLKKVAEKGMLGLYSTLGDIVNVLIYGDVKTKFEASRELRTIDWLVIDEFDSRHVGSESAGELFGRILESILRTRFQNELPTFLITNNPDPTKALGEQLGASIGSLISGYVWDVPVIGADYRKNPK
jgi:DNA replication protein DnaC